MASSDQEIYIFVSGLEKEANKQRETVGGGCWRSLRQDQQKPEKKAFKTKEAGIREQTDIKSSLLLGKNAKSSKSLFLYISRRKNVGIKKESTLG
jgi:hypothetical protein